MKKLFAESKKFHNEKVSSNFNGQPKENAKKMGKSQAQRKTG